MSEWLGIPESTLELSEEEEAVVRTLGNLRREILARYPEVDQAKLNAAFDLDCPADVCHGDMDILHVEISDSKTEAWITEDPETPILSGAFLGGIDFMFKANDNPTIEINDIDEEFSPRKAEKIIERTIEHAKKIGKLGPAT